jgi:3-hydroxybutyryl-CoA dehydrogenase
MTIAILANEAQLQELEIHTNKEGIDVVIPPNIHALNNTYDAIFDFLYTPNPERISLLKKCTCPIFINSVPHTLDIDTSNFIRFNGWNSFIKRTKWEISCSPTNTVAYLSILQHLEITAIALPNISGFVTPRVVSMLINEAYFALGEQVSTKEEIDTAMQLGTNYPYGPFAWCTLIGVEQVYQLLSNLAATDERYTVAPALQEEINALKQ